MEGVGWEGIEWNGKLYRYMYLQYQPISSSETVLYLSDVRNSALSALPSLNIKLSCGTLRLDRAEIS